MRTKKLLSFMLCLVFMFSLFPVSHADANDEMKHNGSSDVEFVCERATKDLIWGDDGWRESMTNSHNNTFERVVGWSTCTNSRGTDVEHYTRARFESLTGTTIEGDSGRVWGTGTVWAYGGWVTTRLTTVMRARVYYGT